MSDDDDKDQAGRPRRATVKLRRRSLRVLVDEVPRRSSPSLPWVGGRSSGEGEIATR